MGGRADRRPAPRPPLHPAQRRPDAAVLLHRQRARARRAVGLQLRRAARPGTSAAVRRVMNESFTTGAGRPARQRRPRRHLRLVRLGGAGHVPGHPRRGHARPARPAVPVDPHRPAERRHPDQRRRRRPSQYVQCCRPQRHRVTSATGCATATSPAARTLAYTMGAAAERLGHRRRRRTAVVHRRRHPAAAGARSRAPTWRWASRPPARRRAPPRRRRPRRSTAASAATASGARPPPAPSTCRSTWARAQNVSSFVVKHAGLGGESTGWNTGAFTIADQHRRHDLDDRGHA